MRFKKILGFAICIVLIMSTQSISVIAVDENRVIVYVSTEAELHDAIYYARQTPTTIKFTNDIHTSETLRMRWRGDIHLTSVGEHMYSLIAAHGATAINTFYREGTLIIDNIRITRNYDGATIGGGAGIQAVGVLIMNGGEISGHRGFGVVVTGHANRNTTGKFIMNDGVILYDVGRGGVENRGEFIHNGGEIIGILYVPPLPVTEHTEPIVLSINECTEPVVLPANIHVGQIIEFGRRNWLVLDVDGAYGLIIHETIIENRPFWSRDWEEAHQPALWQDSLLREWLNAEFLYSFSEVERAHIRMTSLENNVNPWKRIDSYEVDTEDKIFILSLEEVLRYFGDSGLLDRFPNGPGHTSRWGNMSRSDWGAHGNGIHDSYSGARIAYNAESEASRWWLRTQGRFLMFAQTVVVEYDGFINLSGIASFENIGVRPALWLRIEP